MPDGADVMTSEINALLSLSWPCGDPGCGDRVTPGRGHGAAGGGDAMRSPLVRILANMVEAALESRNIMRHASGDEEEGDVAADLQPGVQGESVSQKAQRRAR